MLFFFLKILLLLNVCYLLHQAMFNDYPLINSNNKSHIITNGIIMPVGVERGDQREGRVRTALPAHSV